MRVLATQSLPNTNYVLEFSTMVGYQGYFVKIDSCVLYAMAVRSSDVTTAQCMSWGRWCWPHWTWPEWTSSASGGQLRWIVMRQFDQLQQTGAALNQSPQRTKVPAPLIKSPSQCPGNWRSSILRGRTWILKSSTIWPRLSSPRERSQRLVRARRTQAMSSRCNSPRGWAYITL